MRIAIADDDQRDQQTLAALLERYCSARGLAGELLCFSTAEELLTDFVPGCFQLIFLDIYMGGLDGMEAARQIRREDPSCQIIFFTISQTHAVASYEVRAAWYLVKPVAYHRLEKAMDIACAALLRDSRQLLFHTAGIELSTLLRDVMYLDCADQHTVLHLKNRTVAVDDRARDMISSLITDERFLLCNRNVVVNMDYIQQALESDFLMKNGQLVPIRQRGRAAVKKEYLSWSLRELRNEVIS